MIKKIEISTEYITLGQYLKLADIIDSGGMAKLFIQEYSIKVNGEPETRRGRKLIHEDVIDVEEFGQFQVIQVTHSP